MTAIAMPCEMATFGKDVAFGIAEVFGTEVVHRELVERDIAGRMDVDQSAVHMRSAQRRKASDWTSSTNFALVLKTERMPVVDCVEQIRHLATTDAFSETPQSKKMLSDTVAEARLENAMSLKDDAKLLSHNPDDVLHPKLKPKTTAQNGPRLRRRR